MRRKENRILILSILLSLLIHGLLLILINYRALLGETTPQAQEEQPLEFVFEEPQPPAAEPQPQPQPQEQIPDKFYELVENPNANQQTPDQSSRLSTASSRSSAPVIQPGEISAVPGTETEKPAVSKPQPQEQQLAEEQQAEKQAAEREINEVVENAIMAFRSSHVFDKSALSKNKPRPQKTETKEQDQSDTPKGETSFAPKGFNADLVGDFALSTYEWEWAPYWLAFKRKLNRVWYAPPAYSQLGLIHGYTIVRFKVRRDGSMYDFQVLQHVGHRSLKESSISAIKSSFPFLPLPDSFPDEYLEVTIKMVYPDLRAYRR